jgi:hypothetical protein
VTQRRAVSLRAAPCDSARHAFRTEAHRNSTVHAQHKTERYRTEPAPQQKRRAFVRVARLSFLPRSNDEPENYTGKRQDALSTRC